VRKLSLKHLLARYVLDPISLENLKAQNGGSLPVRDFIVIDKYQLRNYLYCSSLTEFSLKMYSLLQ